MSRVLYGTSEGQTAKVARFSGDAARGLGHEAQVVAVRELTANVSPEGFDAVMVGASIHTGKHEGYVLDFVRENREALESVPPAFFSVSLAAHDDAEEAKGYIEEFVRKTGWLPGKVGLFGGALLYTQYGFIKRRMVKKIARDNGNPDTDTSRDYEYTDREEKSGVSPGSS